MSSKDKNTFDAIVIGSGISGGWSAKELTEKGLKTLLLDRGRDVKHVADYPTAMHHPWDFPHGGQVPLEIKKEYQIASKNFIFSEATSHFLTKDEEQAYIQEKPYDWIRAYHVGGRSLLWGRHTQRWSDFDFTGPARDGFAVDWPIRYQDIAPWYSYVEKFVGISGNKDGLETLPDGDFIKPFELSCVEKHFGQVLKNKYSDRHVIIARTANLSQADKIHMSLGRSQCQHRTLCERGCPYGAYFSSNSATLPAAYATGNLTLKTHAIAHSIIFDENKNKAIGVRVVNALTHEMEEYFASVIFVNASPLATNLILLNSISSRFPNGLGNDAGILGTHMAFHSYRGRITAEYEGELGFKTEGKRPTSGYIPRFRNVYKQETDFLRGYASNLSASRVTENPSQDFIGESLKQSLIRQKLGNWHINVGMMGETIPKAHSTVRLDKELKDKYGIPQLRVSIAYDENDEKMLKDFHQQFTEMYEAAGFKNIQPIDTKRLPGNENHEMGGVRMGRDPKSSMLNAFNQMHHCKNVFVTDGSCMTSTSTQNPSLTYMALTARAVDYAIREKKKRNL
ncbi:GMC oxidoreductase [Aquirufa aurantiipilula]|uniref:GMC family oxidoreductase n=1 Tax=Aquirufa aurantiipilula TaxID=2696561 RepID=A0ABT6BJI5_9BACT|nr:GMC family oxidoreductase [Aquirufa aurantiipilula]MBZ1326857.1 GMC family oxidoreductase [Aquirufa aurantiipilula]MDF5690326.1 GMC family oxidoreductase [Aquirufa aurantiipilula]